MAEISINPISSRRRMLAAMAGGGAIAAVGRPALAWAAAPADTITPTGVPTKVYATSAFTPLAVPARFLDTRRGRGYTGAKPAAGQTITVALAGTLSVPAIATAVVFNLTATESAGAGFVTAWPEAAMPTASSLNLDRADQTRANLVTVPLGGDGAVRLLASVATHLVADLVGFYAPSGATAAGRLVALPAPRRILDTRSGVGYAGAKPAPESVIILPIELSGAASAVVVNLTVDAADGPGYVTAWPQGARPDTSNVNVDGAGTIMANQVIIPRGSDNAIRLYTYAGCHLIVDLVGYFTDATNPTTTAGLFQPVAPYRVLDTRASGERPTGSTLTVLAAGSGAAASGYGAAVVNATLTDTSGAMYLTVFPDGAVPNTSNVNASGPNQIIAGHAITAFGPDGGLRLYNSAATHVVADITGWYLGPAKSSSPQPSFVPPPGYFANIGMTNTARSVFPPFNRIVFGNSGPGVLFNIWSTAAFAPDYSDYGAYIARAGGHYGYFGTETYLADLTTKRWRRLGNPIVPRGLTDWYLQWPDYNNVLTHPDFNKDWGDWFGSVPATPHNYGSLCYWPTSAGGGAKGAVVLGPVHETRGTHALDLAASSETTDVWRRLGTSPNAKWNNNYVPGHVYRDAGDFPEGYWDATSGAVAIDTTRKLFYRVHGAYTGYWVLDLTTGLWSNVTGGDLAYSNSKSLLYLAEKDYLVESSAITESGVAKFVIQVKDASAPGDRFTRVTVSGAVLPSQGTANMPAFENRGLSYCPLNGKFYCYDGHGATTMQTITPPASRAQWKTAPWVLGTETFQPLNGAVPSWSGSRDSSNSGVYTRFHWSDALKSFVWVDHIDQDIQLWRPAQAL